MQREFSKVASLADLGLESLHSLVGFNPPPPPPKLSQCAAQLGEVSSALSQSTGARNRILLRLLLLEGFFLKLF